MISSKRHGGAQAPKGEAAALLSFPAPDAGMVPAIAPAPLASAQGTDPLIAMLRQAARAAQVQGPMDLEHLCAHGAPDASDASDAAALWALALVRTAARSDARLGGRTGVSAMVFHPEGAAAISAAERWLAALARAVGDQRTDSVAFLTRRYLAQAERRLAVCFARRLVESCGGALPA